MGFFKYKKESNQKMFRANTISNRAEKGVFNCSVCKAPTPHDIEATKAGDWADCMVCKKTSTKAVGDV